MCELWVSGKVNLFLLPVTDSWAERYIYLLTYQKNQLFMSVKYTVRPMESYGLRMQSNKLAMIFFFNGASNLGFSPYRLINGVMGPPIIIALQMGNSGYNLCKWSSWGHSTSFNFACFFKETSWIQRKERMLFASNFSWRCHVCVSIGLLNECPPFKKNVLVSIYGTGFVRNAPPKKT